MKYTIPNEYTDEFDKMNNEIKDYFNNLMNVYEG